MNAGLHMSETCTGVHAPPRLTAGQKARAIAFPSVVAREEAYLERKLGDIYRRYRAPCGAGVIVDRRK